MSQSVTTDHTPRKPDNDKSGHQNSLFKVVRVEKSDIPDGETGRAWYHYVLENGSSTITGQRKGTLKDVTIHANRYAEQLNARRNGTHSIWAPRSKK